MSRVLLVSANTMTGPYPVYPLGMATVAAALVRQGHEVRQFDVLTEACSVPQLRQAVREHAPDVIGVSLRNLDSADSLSAEATWSMDSARAFVTALRDASSAPVVLGGPAFSLMPEAILDYLQADFGVVGEGERGVCELVEGLSRGRQPLPRIIDGRATPLAGSDIEAPLLDSALVRFYLDQSGMLNLQTKRGCPWDCTYCSYPGLEGRGYRVRDPAGVVDDLRRMQRDHAAESVFFTDSVFNDRNGHHLELAEAMLHAGIGIRWSAFFRPQGISRQDLALLKRSGLYAMEVGTDGATDATLATAHKGFSFADVLEFDRACAAEQVACAHFVIFGWPGETEASLRQGLVNLAQLKHGIVFAFSGIRVLPGTGIHAQAIHEGVVAAADSLLRPVYYSSPALDPELMNATIVKAFGDRRDRFFPPSRANERLAVLHRFGYRGLLWDRLIPAPHPGRPSRGRHDT
ncbi:MAG: lipid biosynthesis B12-binding/radical SAM protein [Lentisphaerae bacterium RIFOXYB12_FULL_65_16]|nr:MAG: lipid biosynthesis B12-binding/radical SAM protein [Lentisphaerae bacterium RIFOXYA12_64_32]OGV90018.1 MAG: lipid biosynthesis B12-binding/radical SAM protein [Lentisphaerae bacterium RIFOXYB12_FULL_65_16]